MADPPSKYRNSHEPALYTWFFFENGCSYWNNVFNNIEKSKFVVMSVCYALIMLWLKSQNESIGWKLFGQYYARPPLKKVTPPLNGLTPPKNRADCNPPPPKRWFSKISNPPPPKSWGGAHYEYI